MFNYPIPFFLFAILVLWLSARIGAFVRRKHPLSDEDREDFSFVQAATLTLLGLIIGFSFSMAIGRYDQRRNLEEAEANAIGTELGCPCRILASVRYRSRACAAEKIS